MTDLSKPWRVSYWREGIFRGMIGGPELHLSSRDDAVTIADRYLAKARKEGKPGDYRAVRVNDAGNIAELA